MKFLLRNIVLILLPFLICELLLHNPYIIKLLFVQSPNAEWTDGMLNKNEWKETILMGSSLVREGVDPKLLQKGLAKNGIKTTVGSIAVPADRLSIDYFTLNRIMATCSVCPKNIVIGVQDLGLKQTGLEGAYLDTYSRIIQNYLFDKNSADALAQASEQDTLFKRIGTQLQNESLLRTYYFRAHSMNYIRQAVDGILGKSEAQLAIMRTQVAGDPGYGFWSYTVRLTSTPHAKWMNSYIYYLQNYKIGGGETVFLAKFLTLAKQKHLHVYIVLTPESDYYTNAFAKQTNMLRTYIKGIGQEYNASVIDAIDFMPKSYDDYADINHLNKGGADMFSKYLAEVLSKLMR